MRRVERIATPAERSFRAAGVLVGDRTGLAPHPQQGGLIMMRNTTSLALAGILGVATIGATAALPAQATPPSKAGRPTTVASKGSTAKSGAASRAAKRLTLDQLAGRWAMKVRLASGDSTLVTHELVATADTGGWQLIFPNRQPIPVRIVAIKGDSIVTEAGPYTSVLRSGGEQVTTHGVYRLRNGRLVGATVARYASGGPNSVLRVRSEGTRIQ
jgi:hypothetical protein